MPTTRQDDPIRLLHLSDFHFRADKAWDADPVLRALARFIAEEVENGLIPDLVVITGDLAFSGQADEYRLACRWLTTQLLPALGDDFPPSHVLMVPGNHDVDRSAVNFMVEAAQGQLLNSKSEVTVAGVLADERQRSAFIERHAAYLAFLTDWSGTTQNMPWWQRSFKIRNQRIHIAGLDSAWMACGHDADRTRQQNRNDRLAPSDRLP